MEDEARDILRAALSTKFVGGHRNLAEPIRSKIQSLGGNDLKLAARDGILERVELGA